MLSLGGLLLRRRGVGLAWAVSGIAGMLLLAAALRIPDGIPSPSASAAAIAPFGATGTDPRSGNPQLRDVTFQIEPWLIFLRTELRAGRLPFWNPWQFGGTAFWANGQSAPLSPLNLLFVVLPLQIGFVLVPWLRIVTGGVGAYALARTLGVREDAALVAAVVYPLTGMCASFLLFPMGGALSLVPWVFWAAEGVVLGARRWPILSVVLTAQILAGHPETVLHTGLLLALYLALRLEWGSPTARQAIARLAMASVAAALASAVAWLPVALLVRESSRWHSTAGVEPPLGVLLRQPFRLLLPQLFGHPAEGTWWGPFNYSATAVYAGVFGLVLAVAGAWARRGDRRWRALFVVLVAAGIAAYHLPIVRDAIAFLPVVGRALPHRLLFGVELGLAVLAAAGTEAWLSGTRRGLVAGTLVTVLGLGVAWVVFGAAWNEHGQTAEMTRASGVALAGAGALLLSTRLSLAWRSRLVPLLLAGVAIDLVAAHRAINPGLALSRLVPRTGAVAFLASRPERMAGVGDALRPNLAMAYGIADLRGDDPLRTRRFDTAYAALAAGRGPDFGAIESWSAPWLDAMAVRWVLAGPGTPAARPDWRTRYQGDDAVVFERPSARPMVRWESSGSSAGLSVARREPGAWDLAWTGANADRLIVAELGEPGWHASGGPGIGELGASSDGLLALPVNVSSGAVRLRYRPPGFAVGLGLSVLGLAAVAVGSRRRA